MFKFSPEAASVFRLRWIGYALIIFSLLDNVDTIIPLQLMDAEWERQTIGVIVERIPILLMGLGLAFNGEAFRRKRLESVILSMISWACLLMMIFFLLLVPVGISSSVRVFNQRQQGINTQVQRELDQVRVSEAQVKQADSSQLQRFAEQIQQSMRQSPQAAAQSRFDLNDLGKFRSQLLAQLKTSRTQIETRANQLREAQQRTLLKDGIKWSFGALIISLLFLMFWQSSSWARKPKLAKRFGARPLPVSGTPASEASASSEPTDLQKIEEI
jgi:hypothetical protein